MIKNDLTKFLMSIEICCTRHATRKEQEVGICIVVVGKHGIGNNVYAMSACNGELIGDRHCLDRKPCTTEYVNGGNCFHFFEACGEKCVYHFALNL